MDIKHVVKLVEGHAEPLAARCMERLHREAGAEGFLRLPQNDLLVRLTDVYREIGLFLDQPKNDIVRHYFFEAGRMRHRQGLPPEDMVRGIHPLKSVSSGTPQAATPALACRGSHRPDTPADRP